jgi:hypothetical protein
MPDMLFVIAIKFCNPMVFGLSRDDIERRTHDERKREVDHESDRSRAPRPAASNMQRLCREPYEDRQRDDDGQRGEGGDRSGDQGDELDSLDDAHPGAGSGWRGRPGHVVRDDGAGYGNGQRRDKAQAILTLRQFRYR